MGVSMYEDTMDYKTLLKHVRAFRDFLEEYRACPRCKYHQYDEELMYSYCKCNTTKSGKRLCSLINEIINVLDKVENEILTVDISTEIEKIDELSKKLDEILRSIS